MGTGWSGNRSDWLFMAEARVKNKDFSMMVIPRPVWAFCLTLLIVACSGEKGEERRLLGVADNCDVAVTTCWIRAGEIALSLSMGSDVRPLQPFPLNLTIEGGEVDAQSVVADFQMQGMEMGANRYRLIPQPDGWQAMVTLPLCTSSQMDWLATIEFMLDGEPFLAVFRFHTEAN